MDIQPNRIEKTQRYPQQDRKLLRFTVYQQTQFILNSIQFEENLYYAWVLFVYS